MTKMEKPTHFSRRSILKGAGALVVSIGMPIGLDTVLAVNKAYAQGAKPPLTPEQLSSYIAVNSDGTIDAYFGKMDMGQGLFTAIGQIVAEELDVPFNRVHVIMGDTATTVDQGGASGSTGIQDGGKQMRAAAAEARRVLVEMAAQKFGVQPERLIVVDGIVRMRETSDDTTNSVSYADLIGGKYFNVQLQWNKRLGNALYAPGKATPKKPADYKIVGKPIPREDIAPIVYCKEDFVTDVKIPGMLHARMVRPPTAGATPVSVDESSVRNIPGVQIVHEKGVLAVVAPKEWDAIKAADALKVQWSDQKPPFPSQAEIYNHIRNGKVVKREEDKPTGDVEAAFKTAAKVIEAEYEWPFQSHSSMGPACAVVDIQGDRLTVYTGSQKPHRVRNGVASVLNIPAERIRSIWVRGPGSYGRNDAGDAAADAAFIAMKLGKPVRVQYTRQQGTAWDPKGPASIHKARAAIDANGQVIAYDFLSKGFSRLDVDSGESNAAATLAGQFLGVDLKPEAAFRTPEESYEFPNKRMAWETIPPLLDRASPLRTSHLRDPVGPQIHFASESFMDEIAAALNVDPVELRLRHVKNPRDIGVIKAAAEKAGWQPRPSPRRDQTASKLTGRGIAYAQRSGTHVAVVAEVEVDRESGKIWARKFTVAHDCGLIINPDGLTKTIEGNIVQGLSRMIFEEVKFDDKSVTSVDWVTYPILEIADMPETVDVVLINRPDVPSSGAGEPSMRPMAAAVANAVFDATGVRIRRVPFSPDSVKQALS
jgi:CO/xanthine dehydrogenase Mo-binding subunit